MAVANMVPVMVLPNRQTPCIIERKRVNGTNRSTLRHVQCTTESIAVGSRAAYVENQSGHAQPAVILPQKEEAGAIVEYKCRNASRKLQPLRAHLGLKSCNAEKHSGHRLAVILPGLGKGSRDYQQLASSLEAKGIRTFVAKISRLDWLRYAAGLLDGNFWKGTLRPRPVLDWYLKKTQEAVYEANLVANGGKISLIGHSIGGWIARVYLEEFGVDEISVLLTLGTPHRPPPKGVWGVVDQTRGLLDYVDKYCPIANHASKLKYVCIAGRYIKGETLIKIPSIKASNLESVAGVSGSFLITDRHKYIEYINKDTNEGSIDQLTSRKLHASIVGQVYKQVCGQANVWGDGVVPEVSSHIEGAINITLEGVYHSPISSNDISNPWYGSSTIVGKWVHHLL